MRRSLHLALLVLGLGCLGLPLSGCGDAPDGAPVGTGPVATNEPVVWMQAKPSPLGTLTAAVTQRPAPDRVVLEARWGRGDVSGACLVEVLLPVGVLLVEGDARHALDPDAESGGRVWVLDVPQDGRELDAVVRYCVETVEGLRAMECAVRLTR